MQEERWSLAVRHNLVKSLSGARRHDLTRLGLGSWPYALPKTAWSYTSTFPYVFLA
jgi:hypothetical protein